MNEEQKLLKQAAIARSQSQNQKAKQYKRIDVRYDATIIGYSASIGQNVIQQSDGSISYAGSDTNGAMAIGDPVPLHSGTMRVDGLPSMPQVLPKAMPTRTSKKQEAPFAVLFQITEGEFYTFYVGGHQAKVDKLVSILNNDAIYPQTIYFATIDKTKNNYIATIVYLTPIKATAGDGNIYDLVALKILKYLGKRLVYTYVSYPPLLGIQGVFYQVFFNSYHGFSQLFYLNLGDYNGGGFGEGYGGYVVSGTTDTTINSNSYPAPPSSTTKGNAFINVPLFPNSSLYEQAQLFAGNISGIIAAPSRNHLPEIIGDNTNTYAISLNRGEYYYLNNQNNESAFRVEPSLIYSKNGDPITLDEYPFKFDINSLGVSADFLSRRTTLIKKSSNQLVAYCTGQWQNNQGIIDERFDFRNKDVSAYPVTTTNINLTIPIASTEIGNDVSGKIFSLGIGDRLAQIYSISYFPPK